MIPKIAVSSCLLGERVRYDGGHKELALITHELKNFFEITSLCPEMMMGLGVPRPPIYARKTQEKKLELRTRTDDQDLTILAQKTFAEQIDPQLGGIHGYIFKSRSPSCAVRPVEFNQGEKPVRGLFANWTLESNPLLPVVEESDLLTALGALTFTLKVYLVAGLIDAKWARLFEYEEMNEEKFFLVENQLKSLDLPNHQELHQFASLADRLSS